MGTRGIEIVGMDVKELLELLNRAYCDEWLAYYQYWLGAKVVKGPMKDAVIVELEQHATEELNHALMLTNRIIQLGGTPITTPQAWYKWTNCGYDAPDDPYVQTILEQNIKGEQCHQHVPEAHAEDPGGRPSPQYPPVILSQGEHEEDLQALQEDLELMLKRS